MNEVILILVLLAVILNIFIIYRLAMSNSFDKKQKVYQIILVFVLPFIGAFIVWYFLRDDNKYKENFHGNTNTDDSKFYSGGSSSGD